MIDKKCFLPILVFLSIGCSKTVPPVLEKPLTILELTINTYAYQVQDVTFGVNIGLSPDIETDVYKYNYYLCVSSTKDDCLVCDDLVSEKVTKLISLGQYNKEYSFTIDKSGIIDFEYSQNITIPEEYFSNDKGEMYLHLDAVTMTGSGFCTFKKYNTLKRTIMKFIYRH
ncbi:MAG: hypothetical protein MJZ37_01595 [Bacilli bacterium]|nr:hypothetical protein [Bacilli bacterium]